MRFTPISVGAMLLSVAAMLLVLVATPRTAQADCTSGPVRKGTAAEKKAYKEHYDLFLRTAPPAPAGWTATDDPPLNLDECLELGSRPVTIWGFRRTFDSNDAQARQADASRQIEAVMQRSEATRRTNAVRLQQIEAEMDTLATRTGALAAAGRLAEIKAVQERMDRLQEERVKLMAVAETETAIEDISAQAAKDTQALFSMQVGSSAGGSYASKDWKPIVVPVGRGFRQQLTDDHGISTADVAIIVDGSAAAPAMIVHIHGDPARVDQLLKTTKLR